VPSRYCSTAILAQVDGGRSGILLAAEANTPIRRVIINDAGPFVPRIGAYVGQSPVFDDFEGVKKYMREIYAPFGDLSDVNLSGRRGAERHHPDPAIIIGRVILVPQRRV
jgi:hypothetical protein